MTVIWDHEPQVAGPVLVAAFEGWNDAGEAASMAARWLAVHWEATPFAHIDAEEFFDFTVARPQMRMDSANTRHIDWPHNVFAAATPPLAPHPVVLLTGVEPHLKWRTFTEHVVEVAKSLDAQLVVTLGGLLADVPHTWPVRVTGTAADPVLADRLGMMASTYEGPTGIVGVLNSMCLNAGLPTVSLWATVPHYIAQQPSPKAALALVERVATLVSAPVDTAELVDAAAEYEREVENALEDDEDASAYVRELEVAASQDPDSGFGADLPEAHQLATEVERFLREHGR
jgi:predicted ATP-grasp superfamily ATP-dependent carboligase